MGKWMTGLALATLTATVCVSSAWAAKEFFKLDKAELTKSKEFDIKFTEAQASKSGDQEWITICSATAPDSEYGTWKYVDDKATKATLMAPSAPGKYEVRLHQHYPAKSFNVVQRIKVDVK